MSWVLGTFFGLVGYAVGLYLARMSIWRGGDFPVCRACGYDLRGLTRRTRTAARPCPECGGILDPDTIQRASSRFARRPATYMSVILIVVSSFVLGACITFGMFPMLW